MKSITIKTSHWSRDKVYENVDNTLSVKESKGILTISKLIPIEHSKMTKIVVIAKFNNIGWLSYTIEY